jgi:hypothetical protein
MIKVRFVQKGLSPTEFAVKIGKNVEKVKLGTFRAAQETARHMKEEIETSTLRHPSTGRLSKSIRTHKTSTGYGVGKITDLPPYWYVQNYGAKVSGGKFIPGGGKKVRGDFAGNAPDGQFAGQPGGAGEKMNHPGKFVVQASHPIEPKRYIEKTKNWLRQNIKNLLAKAR